MNYGSRYRRKRLGGVARRHWYGQPATCGRREPMVACALTLGTCHPGNGSHLCSCLDRFSARCRRRSRALSPLQRRVHRGTVRPDLAGTFPGLRSDSYLRLLQGVENPGQVRQRVGSLAAGVARPPRRPFCRLRLAPIRRPQVAEDRSAVVASSVTARGRRRPSSSPARLRRHGSAAGADGEVFDGAS